MKLIRKCVLIICSYKLAIYFIALQKELELLPVFMFVGPCTADGDCSGNNEVCKNKDDSNIPNACGTYLID